MKILVLENNYDHIWYMCYFLQSCKNLLTFIDAHVNNYYYFSMLLISLLIALNAQNRT